MPMSFIRQLDWTSPPVLRYLLYPIFLQSWIRGQVKLAISSACDINLKYHIILIRSGDKAHPPLYSIFCERVNNALQWEWRLHIPLFDFTSPPTCLSMKGQKLGYCKYLLEKYMLEFTVKHRNSLQLNACLEKLENVCMYACVCSPY